MAAKYEIKEVGFVGSLWQGDFFDPINVGRTVEVTHILKTIDSGRRQSIHFATSEQLDIERINNHLPTKEYSFYTGKLSTPTLDDLFIRTDVNQDFFRNQTILFRYNVRGPKDDTNTSIPIQENWSFDVSDPNNPKYLYNRPETILYVPFVVVVSESYLNEIISYFQSIDELQEISNPPSFEQGTNVIQEISPTTFLPGKSFIGRPRFSKIVINEEEEAERLAIELFETKLGQISGRILSNGTVDNEFPAVDPLFEVSSIEQFNSNLAQVNELQKIARENLERSIVSVTPTPFTDRIQSLTAIIYFEMVRNYLFDQLRKLENVGFAEEEPERYSVDQDGNIEIIPLEGEVLSQQAKTTAESAAMEVLEFDDLIDEIIEDLEIDDNNTYVFKKISKVSDYDLPIRRYKTKGLFKCTGEKLSTFHTGSNLTEKQKMYYLSVFNEPYGQENGYHQFDISYCHIGGSGSLLMENEVDLSPSKTMYKKYMMECWGTNEGKFKFKNGKNGDYFYVIQLDREVFKEKLDAGNFELALCELSSSVNQLINTGSNFRANESSSKLFTLIDESRDSKQEIVTNEGIQEYYYITSGSLRDGVYNESEDDAWGVVFPKMGLIVLDGVVLDQSCSFNTVTSSMNGDNTRKLFVAISGAAVPTNFRPSSSFFARSFETFLTETYFCRADFNEFNNSTNYTYVSGSDGFIKYDYFKKEPHAYITTIGLYNKHKELLAVGKLHRPMLKNDGKVCIFEVRVRIN